MDAVDNVLPTATLNKEQLATIFQYFFRRLASYRNTCQLYAAAENQASSLTEEEKQRREEEFEVVLNEWAQNLVEQAWNVCHEPGGHCPQLDAYADTSLGDLGGLPSANQLSRILNATLFLVVTSTRVYSARTRSFLLSMGNLNEEAVTDILKRPEDALKRLQEKAHETTESHAERGKTLRRIGMGLGAVAGGVLVGITGGLAAPLVGASIATVLGWVGLGGTAAGLFASGLAGSTVVCGALFGAYGARSSADMVERYTREVRDLKILPVRPIDSVEESLGVRLCVSGWLDAPEDVVAPWTIFNGDNTYALQWEVEALQELSGALMTLVKSHTMKFIQAEIIKRTIFASLLASLSPLAWLKIGQIIDNPWMTAKALAVKTGAVLGELIANRVFGSRPLTLTGYSLGSLVIFEALRHLASLPSRETVHLIQDVFLFGTPVPTDDPVWTAARRLASGRVVNGYASADYVLAVMSRVSDVAWDVAGLAPVRVMGVENVLCEEVDGHTKWRGLVGRCLLACDAAGVNEGEVERQVREVAIPMAKETDSITETETGECVNTCP